MISGDFITFGNNQLKMTQFSHTPEVTLFSPSFTTPEPMPKGWGGTHISAMGGQPLQGINRHHGQK